MDLSKLTVGEKVVLGAGLLLVIDLLFLPWHNIDLGIIDVSRKGVQSPNALWGVLALLVTIAMIAAVVVSRFSTTTLPKLPVPWSQAMFLAGVLVFVLLLLKLVIETDFLGFGAYLGVLLGGALAFGGFTMRKEAAGTASPPII